MEQVLYYLLRLTNKNCLSTLPWPIHSLKEAAEFRNGATVIINVSNNNNLCTYTLMVFIIIHIQYFLIMPKWPV